MTISVLYATVIPRIMAHVLLGRGEENQVSTWFSALDDLACDGVVNEE